MNNELLNHLPIPEVNTSTEDLAARKDVPAKGEDPPLLNISAIKHWMSVEISFRVARGWVLGAGLLFLLILAFALD